MEKQILDLTGGKFLYRTCYSRDGETVYELVFESTRIILSAEQMEKLEWY
jgi:hypothetical protein